MIDFYYAKGLAEILLCEEETLMTSKLHALRKIYRDMLFLKNYGFESKIITTIM